MYILNEKLQKPLYIQLFEAIKEDILTQKKTGDKLPSIRKLSNELNISITTVKSAYLQLYAEGFIEPKPKKGYFVNKYLYKNIKTPTNKNIYIDNEKSYKTVYRYDFYPAHLRKEDFPLKIWKRCFNKAIDETIDFGSYSDGRGEATLRAEIASYLATLREVKCNKEQIIICSGFIDAISLIAKLLKKRYNIFGIEEPGYHIAKKVFQEYGYNVKEITVGNYGIQLSSLKSSNAKLIYTTPSHQYPTGVTIPISKRVKILEYIDKIEGFIIEDDYDSELAYNNRPIPSLQGLDTNDRVIYLGTFAKSLSPALRIGYIVLPKQLLNLYKKRYDARFPRVCVTAQKTLEIFLKDGHWERHLRKIRTINKKKHNLLKQLLHKKIGNTFKIVAEGAGLAILINPTVPFDWIKFKNLAEQNSIKLYFAKEKCGGNFEAIRMGFGGFSEKELIKAIEAFTSIWQESILVI